MVRLRFWCRPELTRATRAGVMAVLKPKAVTGDDKFEILADLNDFDGNFPDDESGTPTYQDLKFTETCTWGGQTLRVVPRLQPALGKYLSPGGGRGLFVCCAGVFLGSENNSPKSTCPPSFLPSLGKKLSPWLTLLVKEHRGG